MAKREPLGRDPLEWIKRTKPADDEEEQPQAEQPAETPEQAAPQPPQPPEEQASWLDSIAQSEEQPASPEPAPEQAAVAPEQLAPEPETLPETAAPAEPATAEATVEGGPPADMPGAAEPPTTVQAEPGEEPRIEVRAPEPPSTEWPAAVVQEIPPEGEALPSAIAQPDEEQPTEVLGVSREEEEVTAEKLRAEAHYVHVGSTDDEVGTLPKPDSDEYAAVGFPGEERSLLFPIVMIVCVFLMGLLVYMWAETRIRGVEQRLSRVEKKLNETRGADE